jgi:hypothetical protein
MSQRTGSKAARQPLFLPGRLHVCLLPTDALEAAARGMGGRYMTNEQIRIKIAESLGWTEIAMNGLYDQYEGLKPKGNYRNRNDWLRLPDYPEDLNACAEMEKSLGSLRPLYDVLLIELTSEGEFDHNKIPIVEMHYVDALTGIHATAAQKCRAYVAVKGLNEIPHH